MSETTSSPSVHLHPMSPSSSLSSTDSAPRSEPTSDEQPDLGAFTTVLREWTHLQPPPRIPVQIHSATSSTTPTYQPEQSVIGSNFRVRSNDRNSRLSNHSGFSDMSSFTRPPSSSLHPEGSTVWNQALIASYLFSSTPSNDISEEDEEAEYTPSPPNSPASTALTVEIASETDNPSFDEGLHDVQPESSPYPGINLPIPLASDGQRLDSRETAHAEDEVEAGSSHTSRDYLGSHLTSIQLQSQACDPTSTSDSLSIPTIQTGLPSISTLSNTETTNASNSSTSTSTSTLITTLLNRSQNPLPPRTMSDSSYTGSAGSSSSLSFVSYRIPETPPIEEEDEEDISRPPLLHFSSSSLSNPSTSGSGSLSLKSQKSITSYSPSASTSTLTTQRQHQQHLPPRSSLISSVVSSESPLFNPHSPLPNSALSQQQALDIARPAGFGIVDDLGTPDQPPSETLIFEPYAEKVVDRRSEFLPVDDLDVEDEDNLTHSFGQKVQPFGHASKNGPLSAGPSSLRDYFPSSSLQHRHHTSDALPEGKRESHLGRLPEQQYSDDDGQTGDGDDDDYPYRYPYIQSSKTHTQALTPKGIPRPGPRTETQAQDLMRQYGFSHTLLPDHAQNESHTHYVQPEQSHSQRISTGLQSQARSQASTLTESQLFSSSEEVIPHREPFVQHRPQPTQYPAQSYRTTDNSDARHLPPIQNAALPFQSTKHGQTETNQIFPQIQAQQHGQRYPHSLRGLHVLPTSITSLQAEKQPVSGHHFEPALAPRSGLDPISTTVVIPGLTATLTRNNDDEMNAHLQPSDPQPLIVEADSLESSDVGLDESSHLPTSMHLDEEEQTLPSLGYLDEALSFIAAERARWSAAREGPSANGSGAGDVADSREVGGGGGEGGGDSGQEANDNALDEGGKGKQVSDTEPKRRRRRKRPPRAHATPQAAASDIHSTLQPPPSSAPSTMTNIKDGQFEDATSAPFTPTSSPKKKKRSKSASASASGSTPSRLSLLESPSKSKGKGKNVEKEFLVPLPSKSLPGEKAKPAVTILRRPVSGHNVENGAFSDDDLGAEMVGEEYSDGGDGGKTPTNALERGDLDVHGSDGLLPIDYTGKKGRRVGRREREKERMRREAMKLQEAQEKDASGGDDKNVEGLGRPLAPESDDDDNDGGDGTEPHEDEDGDDDDDDDDDDQGENDSLSNMALLQPPRRNRSRSRRRRGRETAYIHDLAGIGVSGVYKSTPGTPRRSKFDNEDPAEELEEEVRLQPPAQAETVPEDNVFVTKPNVGMNPQAGEKKKRVRTKRMKGLTRAKSDPELRLDELGVSPAAGGEPGKTGTRGSRNRNIRESADDSMDILDMDRNQLQRLIFASSGAGSQLLLANQQRVGNRAQPPPDSKRGRLLTLANQLFQLFPEQREELGRVISRISGQDVATSPGKGKRNLKTGVNVNSYGLYGVTAVPLKRKRSKKGGHVRTASEGTEGEAFEFENEPIGAEGGSARGSVPFPGIDEEEEEEEEIDPRGQAPKKGDVLIHVFIDHSNILIGLLSHLKRHPPPRKIVTASARGRPVSAVLSTDPVSAFAAVKSTAARPLPIPIGGEVHSGSPSKRQPRPVPKSGNHPIPLPSFATTSRSLPSGSSFSSNGKGNNKEDSAAKDENSDDYENVSINVDQEDSSGPGSLFVGSIKKEKKVPKHLWHAALTLILERGRPITRRVVVTSSPLYQPMESIVSLGYDLRIFIRVPDLGDGMDRERHRDKDRNTGKGVQSSPVAIPGANFSSKKGHERHISGSTSTESGSGGGGGSGHGSGGGGSGSAHVYTGITNDNNPQTKIKYREQGVDELLQLKLHQAIAATDDPPDGSTIVLATGDGNMGQFNEDGFLGPVRIALRRGWRVELYAWEDGLSRAWRREFGAGTEWGRRGMFQVIGMEQFASALVEASGWS